MEPVLRSWSVVFCSCKPRIGGRKCDRCAAGFYRFPDCLPCKCNQSGVTPQVCHPDTGRCLCKVSLFFFLSFELELPFFLNLVKVISCSLTPSPGSSVVAAMFVDECCWCQVWHLSAGFLLLWPVQPSRLYQLLLLQGHWPVSELKQTQGEGVCVCVCFCVSCLCLSVDAFGFCCTYKSSALIAVTVCGKMLRSELKLQILVFSST